jgi:hypothetical protein
MPEDCNRRGLGCSSLRDTSQLPVELSQIVQGNPHIGVAWAEDDLLQPERRPVVPFGLLVLLEDGEYTERAVEAVLGPAHSPAGWPDLAIQQRRLPADRRLSTLLELFYLGEAVRLPDARRARAPARRPRLAALGLVSLREDGVRARVRLVPYEGLIVAGDRLPADPARPPTTWPR